MSKKEEGGFFSPVWDSLSSLRLTIALLILLAVTSIFGTVIPQNASPEEYLRLYKVSTYKILKILGFLDMYHAGWFFLLLALLCLNLIACSLRRFWLTLRFFVQPEDRLGDGLLKSLPLSRRFSRKGPLTESLSHSQEVLSRLFSRPRVIKESGSTHLFAEKEKLSRLGVYMIHLSVLVILAGSLIGSFFGFRGNLNVLEGQVEDRVILRNGQQIRLPGFHLRLDKFNVSFYPTGAPKEFKSTVTISEGGRKILTEAIRVNEPLTYRGLTFYQSNYGVAGVQKAVIAIRDRESGKELSVPAEMGVRTEIPGTSSAFLLSQFSPDLQGMGPALRLVLFEANRPHDNFWIFHNRPELEDRRPGRYRFGIKEMDPKFYSGLQVTKDPGVWVVWLGCLLMMAGFYMTFFMSHRRVWVRLAEKGGGTVVELAASSHRDRLKFEKEFETLHEALSGKSPSAGRATEESEGRP